MNNERNIIAKKVSIWGIIGNFLLFLIKIVIGILSHSQSMIADSFNSAGDVFASFMTWIGNRISSVPNDNDHNFGHGKAEYIFSMLISISMIVVAGYLFYDSLESIIHGNQLIFSYHLLIVCFITFLVKISLYLYAKKNYLKKANLLIKANMLDHRNDMVITLFTTISIILAKNNIYFVDGIVGIGISLWIFITGVKIFKESYDVLMDISLDNESKNNLLEIIQSYHEVKRIGNIYSIPIGYKYIVVLTIFVDGQMQTKDSHLIADEIETKIIKNSDKIEQVIVHVEPYN